MHQFESVSWNGNTMMKRNTKISSHIDESANRVLRFLKQKRKQLSPLLILTHDFPDADALASAFALQYLAKTEFGIVSSIAYGGAIGRMENRTMVKVLRMPVHKLRARDLKTYSHIATVDTQPSFENNSFPKGRCAALVIDQHASDHPPVALMSVVNEHCGATSVILAQCFLLMKRKVPSRLATALAYGIISDTQNFYRCPHPEVFQTYLKILEYCDLKMLVKIQNPPRPKDFFITLGKGMRNAFVQGRLIVSCLGEVNNPDKVSLVTDFLLPYQGILWAFCIGRYKKELFFSIRGACADFQAGEVLRDICEHRGQAGGHDTIAGGSIRLKGASRESDWKKAEQGLILRLAKRLRIEGKECSYRPFE